MAICQYYRDSIEIFYLDHIYQTLVGILKDKNDVEIYEDDLVCIFEVYIHEVIFQDGAFGYITNDDFIPFGHNCYFNWINGKSDDIKVVGNVHDDK